MVPPVPTPAGASFTAEVLVPNGEGVMPSFVTLFRNSAVPAPIVVVPV